MLNSTLVPVFSNFYCFDECLRGVFLAHATRCARGTGPSLKCVKKKTGSRFSLFLCRDVCLRISNSFRIWTCKKGPFHVFSYRSLVCGYFSFFREKKCKHKVTGTILASHINQTKDKDCSISLNVIIFYNTWWVGGEIQFLM